MAHRNARIAKLHNDFKKQVDSEMENLKENGFINSFSNPLLSQIHLHNIEYHVLIKQITHIFTAR